VVNFTPLPLYPRYPFYRRLDIPQCWSGRYREDIILPLPGIELRLSSPKPVSIPTERSQSKLFKEPLESIILFQLVFFFGRKDIIQLKYCGVKATKFCGSKTNKGKKFQNRHISQIKWTQNYWVFGLCPSSCILKTREHNVSEAGSVFSQVSGSVRKSYPQSLDPVILSVIHHRQNPSEST
jgi:hypothetical protein